MTRRTVNNGTPEKQKRRPKRRLRDNISVDRTVMGVGREDVLESALVL